MKLKVMKPSIIKSFLTKSIHLLVIFSYLTLTLAPNYALATQTTTETETRPRRTLHLRPFPAAPEQPVPHYKIRLTAAEEPGHFALNIRKKVGNEVTEFIPESVTPEKQRFLINGLGELHINPNGSAALSREHLNTDLLSLSVRSPKGLALSNFNFNTLKSRSLLTFQDYVSAQTTDLAGQDPAQLLLSIKANATFMTKDLSLNQGKALILGTLSLQHSTLQGQDSSYWIAPSGSLAGSITAGRLNQVVNHGSVMLPNSILEVQDGNNKGTLVARALDVAGQFTNYNQLQAQTLLGQGNLINHAAFKELQHLNIRQFHNLAQDGSSPTLASDAPTSTTLTIRPEVERFINGEGAHVTYSTLTLQQPLTPGTGPVFHNQGDVLVKYALRAQGHTLLNDGTMTIRGLDLREEAILRNSLSGAMTLKGSLNILRVGSLVNEGEVHSYGTLNADGLRHFAINQGSWIHQGGISGDTGQRIEDNTYTFNGHVKLTDGNLFSHTATERNTFTFINKGNLILDLVMYGSDDQPTLILENHHKLKILKEILMPIVLDNQGQLSFADGLAYPYQFKRFVNPGQIILAPSSSVYTRSQRPIAKWSFYHQKGLLCLSDLAPASPLQPSLYETEGPALQNTGMIKVQGNLHYALAKPLERVEIQDNLYYQPFSNYVRPLAELSNVTCHGNVTLNLGPQNINRDLGLTNIKHLNLITAQPFTVAARLTVNAATLTSSSNVTLGVNQSTFGHIVAKEGDFCVTASNINAEYATADTVGSFRLHAPTGRLKVGNFIRKTPNPAEFLGCATHVLFDARTGKIEYIPNQGDYFDTNGSKFITGQKLHFEAAQLEVGFTTLFSGEETYLDSRAPLTLNSCQLLGNGDFVVRSPSLTLSFLGKETGVIGTEFSIIRQNFNDNELGNIGLHGNIIGTVELQKRFNKFYEGFVPRLIVVNGKKPFIAREFDLKNDPSNRADLREHPPYQAPSKSYIVRQRQQEAARKRKYHTKPAREYFQKKVNEWHTTQDLEKYGYRIQDLVEFRLKYKTSEYFKSPLSLINFAGAIKFQTNRVQIDGTSLTGHKLYINGEEFKQHHPAVSISSISLATREYQIDKYTHKRFMRTYNRGAIHPLCYYLIYPQQPLPQYWQPFDLKDLNHFFIKDGTHTLGNPIISTTITSALRIGEIIHIESDSVVGQFNTSTRKMTLQTKQVHLFNHIRGRQGLPSGCKDIDLSTTRTAGALQNLQRSSRQLLPGMRAPRIGEIPTLDARGMRYNASPLPSLNYKVEIPIDLLFLAAMSEHAGRAFYQGRSGPALLEHVISQSQQLNCLEKLNSSTELFLFYVVQQAEAALHVHIPKEAQTTADICVEEGEINTTHNNRIENLQVEYEKSLYLGSQEGDVDIVTGKTTHHQGSRSQEVAYNQAQLLGKKGSKLEINASKGKATLTGVKIDTDGLARIHGAKGTTLGAQSLTTTESSSKRRGLGGKKKSTTQTTHNMPTTIRAAEGYTESGGRHDWEGAQAESDQFVRFEGGPAYFTTLVDQRRTTTSASSRSFVHKSAQTGFEQAPLGFHQPRIKAPLISFYNQEVDAQGLLLEGLIIEDATEKMTLGAASAFYIKQFNSHLRSIGGYAKTTVDSGQEILIPSQIQAKIFRSLKNPNQQAANILKLVNTSLDHIEQVEIEKAVERETRIPKQWHQATHKSNFKAAQAISLAIGIASMGTGSTVTATLQNAFNLTENNIAQAMLKTTFQKIVVKASHSLLVNNGSLKATIKDLTSRQSIRDLAISAIAAGLLEGVSEHLDRAKAPHTFLERLENHSLQQVTNASVRAAFGDGDLVDNIVHNLRYAAVDAVGEQMVHHIGVFYKTGEINPIVHKLAHTVTGGLTAKLRGEDPLSGAVGALVGEVAAELKEMASQDDLIERVLNNINAHQEITGEEPTAEFFQEILRNKRLSYARFGRYTALTVAALADLEVETALHTATTAVEHNFLPVILGAIAVANLASNIHTAYEIYCIARDESIEDALTYAATLGLIKMGTGIAGKAVFHIAGKAITSPKLAWAALCKDNTVLGKIASRGKELLEKGYQSLKNTADKVGQSASAFKAKHAGKVDALINKGKDKVGVSAEAKQAGKVAASDTAEQSTQAAAYGRPYPNRSLPRDKHGNPLPDPEAIGRPHTQLGNSRQGKYPQAREFDKNGKPVKDIDFTDHGRPHHHPNPHQHPYVENETGGTLKRGTAQPLKPKIPEQ